jgi:hypothetical protein
METATEFELRLVRWQFFGTFTWSASQLGSCQKRENDFWSFMRDWTELNSVKLVSLPIALRWERGDIGERPHAHALIAGMTKVTINEGFKWSRLWNHQRSCRGGKCKGCKYGFAKIRLFDPFEETNPYSYIEKHANKISRNNKYEVGKFDYADRLVITDAAWRIMLASVGAEYIPQHRTA